MNKTLLHTLCTLSILAHAFPAIAENTITPESLELKVSRIGDLEMSCGELSQEALLMKDIVNTTQDIKDESELQKHGITAAGAVGSFLVGTFTGGIGLAAAGFLLDHNVDGKSEYADSVQDIAEQRRTLMLGIHHAKGCYGPTEHTMLDNNDTPKPLELASIEPASGDEESSYQENQKPHYNE